MLDSSCEGITMPWRCCSRPAGVAGMLLSILLAPALSLHAFGESPVEQLADLTGQTIAIATLKARDNFANQFEYDVTVRNLSSDPLEADSLIVVVDSITDLAGKDATDRIEVVGFDGYTKEGKPYYRVPTQDLALPAYGVSQPARVRLRNPYYTILFTPSFKVRGLRRLDAGGQESVQGLVDALIKRGLLSEEEGRALNQRAPTP